MSSPPVVSFDGPVAYARSPEHDRFLRAFQGSIRGRYLLAYLVGLEILGGVELRRRIEGTLGDVRPSPTEMYDARFLVMLCDRALRASVVLDRVHELLVPAYARANPTAFDGMTVLQALRALDAAYRQETSFGSIGVDAAGEPGRARLRRVDNPAPCEGFPGVVQGLYHVLGVQGSVHEQACQWRGAEACLFEARWEEPASAERLNARSAAPARRPGRPPSG